ncbi:unnamed protein product, partial [Laminaria digitata]
MNPTLMSTLLTLAQQPTAQGERELARQWSALMLVLILLTIIALTGLGFLLAQRRARRRKDALPKPKNAPDINAWEEAGRRLDDSFVVFDDE